MSESRASLPDRTWWRSAVLYQIYPRSFADSDGDGIGDLAGIAAHLDHLRGAPDALNVDGIWLSPIYPSPQKDFGYDISDYCAIDPAYGNLRTFDLLVAEAHRRGLKVLLDLVPGHTSDQHPWFQAARRSRDDPHRELYIWADPAPDGGAPNNWTAAFGGSAWQLEERTGQYYLHSFYPEQPDLNWRTPQTHERMADVVRFWLARGVDGFRVDAIDRSMKDALLRENPPAVPGYLTPFMASGDQLHVWNKNRPETVDVVRSIRAAATAARADVMLLGEAYLPVEILGRYLGTPEQPVFDLAFDFTFIATPWDADEMRVTIEGPEAHLPAHGWPCRALSNHDNPRHGTRFGARALRPAAVLLLTLRGTPVLYMGEEIGMLDVPPPAGIRFDRFGRDACRTPMQWSSEAGGGFTGASPWLPLGDIATVNAQDQRPDPRSLLSLYRELLRLRHASAALSTGTFRSIDLPAGSGAVAYLREADGERLVVIVSFRSEPVQVDLRRAARGRLGASGAVVLSTVPERGAGDPVDLAAVSLAPDEALIVELQAR